MCIPNGEYTISKSQVKYKLLINNLYVFPTLISNDIYVRWLNKLGIKNHIGGTYLMINDINVNNPISYDSINHRYIIKDGYERHPVRGVTWSGAALFAIVTGGRLMTELEWEVCAKSGKLDYEYPWGSILPTDKHANHSNIIGDTTEVDVYPTNEWGLYDMAGNLREWCADKYHPSCLYPLNQRIENISSEYRVVKGGAWDKTAVHLKCSVRAGKWWRIGTTGIGFRVVYDDPELEENIDWWL